MAGEISLAELENEVDCSVPASLWLSLVRSVFSSVSVPRLRVGPREPGHAAAWTGSPFTCDFTGLSLEVIYWGVDAISGIAASGSEL